MNITLVKWTLAAMLKMQPAAITPWSDTYQSTAETFVQVAEEQPLFRGKDGVRRTVAVFLSVGWFEGTFKQNVEGDHDKLPGGKKGKPHSFCMMQVGGSNLEYLGITKEEILSDFGKCVRASRKMMEVSFGVCKGRPELDLLGHYASGGSVCAGIRESKNRMTKAKWAFSLPYSEEEEQ